MPITSVSTVTGATGRPSLWVTVSRWPPRARRKAVSAAALTTRRRSRSPGRAWMVGGWAAVEQVQRVVDLAAGSAEHRACVLAALTHHAHAALAHHAALGRQPRLQLLRRGADPVGPVVQHHHLLVVAAARLGRVVDQQRPVEATVELQAHV